MQDTSAVFIELDVAAAGLAILARLTSRSWFFDSAISAGRHCRFSSELSAGADCRPIAEVESTGRHPESPPSLDVSAPQR
jgi:hypothetical protein